MQTIPDKLNALRHSIEASVQGQILDTRLNLERRLKEAATTAEESAYGRALQELAPQLSDLDARMSDELPKVRLQLNEAVNLCRQIADSVTAGSQARLQKLDVEIAGFRVELPPLRDNIQKNAEFLEYLGNFPPEFRRVVEATREELDRVAAELRSDLEKETRRAEYAEGALSGQLQKTGQTASEKLTETQGVLQQTRDQVNSAMEQTAMVEDKLHGRLTEYSERAVEVSKQHATEVTTGLRPEIQQTVQDAKRAIEEYREVVDTRLAKLEAKLRDELTRAIAEASEEEERRLEEKDAELSAGMSLGLAEMRRDVAAVREALRQGLLNTSTDIIFRIDSDKVAFEHRCEELQGGLNATEAHYISLAEEDLPQMLERQKQTDVAVNELRSESVEARTKLREHLEAAQQELQVAFEQKSDLLYQQQTEARLHAEQALEKTAESLRMELRTEFLQGLQKAQQGLDALRTDSDSALASEVAERRVASKVMDESLRKHFRDSIEDARLALMSSIAAVDSRVDAAEQRDKSLAEETTALRQVCDAQEQQQRSDTERLGAQLLALGARTDSLEEQTKMNLDDLRRRSEDQLAHEAANLWVEISRVRSVCQEDVAKFRADIPKWATKEDLAEVRTMANFAISETKEAQLHIRAAEKSVDRHREFWESQARNLGTRCDEVEGDVSRIKLRIHQETCVLGTELSELRCATTSLTHGVLTGLQILGFLDEEILHKPRAPLLASPPTRRLGIDVNELLEWEKAGMSLAARVTQRWNAFDSAGTASLLSLVSRKAEEHEVRRLRACLTLALPNPFPKSPTSGKPWTPSTTADGSVFHDSSPLEGLGGPLAEFETEFQPVPPSGDPTVLSTPRRPNLSSRPLVRLKS